MTKAVFRKKNLITNSNELSEATGNPNFKNSPIEALLNSTAIEDWSKELEKNLTNNNTLISENEATMAEYEKTMRELAKCGFVGNGVW